MFNQVFGELISENIEEGLVVIRYEVNVIRYQRFLSVMKVKAVKLGNHLTRRYLVAVVITRRAGHRCRHLWHPGVFPLR